MKLRITCKKHLWFLVSVCILLLSVSFSFSADSISTIKIDLIRTAYYRGESVPVNITYTNGSSQILKDVVLVARLSDNLSASAKIKSVPANSSVSHLLRLPTALLKTGEYELKVSAGNNGGNKIVASEKVFIGKKPNPDTMLVWAWGGQGDQWYRKHGYNSWPGSVWRQQDYANDMAFRKRMDDAIRNDAFANILPSGGISPGYDIDLSKISDPDSRYIGLSSYYKEHNYEIGNPFHPEIVRQQNERNTMIMETVKNYPQAKFAFFNSEIGDMMEFNQNKAGMELMKDMLGFTDTKTGEPSFVAPNVIADDDKGYLLYKYIYKYGKGVQTANKRTADMVRRYRPDILTMTDPYRETGLLDMFEGIDVIGTWTYTNPDPKLMLYVETMQAVCKHTNQIPLNVVTTLNYPGDVAPTDKWMLMGPGRMKVTTWINLSRAPKIMSNYYGSMTGDPAKDTFESPLKTTLAFKEISDNVIVPYGPMITNLDVSPRKIAVLSSTVSRLYGKSPNVLGYGNNQIYHFYTVMAMAHIQADVLLDESIERYGLDDYDVLVLPRCDVLAQNVYNKILDFKKRGGIIISDQYLGPQIPDVIKFDFDFSYRDKVTANAIANNKIYAQWDDHIDPKNTAFKEVKGITAMDDQKIMESYAKILKDGLKGIVDPEVDCDQPTVLFNMLEKDGVKYLVVINDKRSYDDWVGKYKAVMEKLEPQKTTIRLDKWNHSGIVAYDMLEKKAISVKKVGDVYQFDLSLSELGGKIIALYPRKISKMAIDFPKNIAQGDVCPMLVSLKDTSGAFVSGLQPVKLTVTDPKGEVSSISDYYCAKTGNLELNFTAAINDIPGKWKISAFDLTSGLKAEQYFTLVKK